MAETRSSNRNLSRDRNLVSDQPWEMKTIHKDFPEHSHEQVKTAIEQCKQNLSGSEDRGKIMDCLKSKLSMGNAK